MNMYVRMCPKAHTFCIWQAYTRNFALYFTNNFAFLGVVHLCERQTAHSDPPHPTRAIDILHAIMMSFLVWCAVVVVILTFLLAPFYADAWCSIVVVVRVRWLCCPVSLPSGRCLLRTSEAVCLRARVSLINERVYIVRAHSFLYISIVSFRLAI